jgi:hypothetical protein
MRGCDAVNRTVADEPETLTVFILVLEINRAIGCADARVVTTIKYKRSHYICTFQNG